MESLKEKLGRGPKKIKKQQDETRKELYPVFKEIEDLNKRKAELQKEFNRLGHREGENFILNEGVVKMDPDGDYYIHFMGSNYRLTGEKGRIYDVSKDDDGEGYIYIGGTDSFNNLKWSGKGYILRSNGFIFEGRNFLLGGNGVRYAPNGMIYSGDTPRREPLDPEKESFIYLREGSYYEPDGKKTSYKLTPPTSEELNTFQDRFSENEIIYTRGKVLETTVQQIGEDIKHTFSSRGEEIKFTENDEDYIFTTGSKQLHFPKSKGKHFIESFADFINSVIHQCEQSGFSQFNSHQDSLSVTYNAGYFRIRLRNRPFLKNIEKQLGISSEELAERLNQYIKEIRSKKYYTNEEKRGRPRKI